MKIQQLDISGQEILTADKVAVRLNIICNYRITNPEKLVQTVEGVASPALYLCPAEAAGVCGAVQAG